MRDNHVRSKVLAGKPTIGSFMGLGSPNVAELMSHAGFDWLVIETEHNGLDAAEVQNMLMAMNGTNTVPIVRIPSASPVYIQRALDLGGMGIVVPMVKTEAEARAIVSATRYPPIGTRGFGPLRASHYTYDNADYFTRVNDHILVVLIIETKEALDKLEEIARVPGVDVLFIGPADLSIALGKSPLDPASPELESALNHALEVGRRTGKAIGYGTSSPDGLQKLLARGFSWIVYGPDYWLIKSAISIGIEAFQKLITKTA
jgi:4-hydroxy-2-oxoheptanedioate aldolase